MGVSLLSSHSVQLAACSLWVSYSSLLRLVPQSASAGHARPAPWLMAYSRAAISQIWTRLQDRGCVASTAQSCLPAANPWSPLQSCSSDASHQQQQQQQPWTAAMLLMPSATRYAALQLHQNPPCNGLRQPGQSNLQHNWSEELDNTCTAAPFKHSKPLLCRAQLGSYTVLQLAG